MLWPLVGKAVGLHIAALFCFVGEFVNGSSPTVKNKTKQKIMCRIPTVILNIFFLKAENLRPLSLCQKRRKKKKKKIFISQVKDLTDEKGDINLKPFTYSISLSVTSLSM